MVILLQLTLEGFDDTETEDTTAELGYSSNEVTNFEDLSLETIENILNFGVEDQNVSTYSIAPSYFAAKSSATKSSAMRQVDLVLVVDTTGSMGSQIAAVKTKSCTMQMRVALRQRSIFPAPRFCPTKVVQA